MIYDDDAPELYKKYRPKSLKDLIGQDIVVQKLTAMAKHGGIPHAMLFAGGAGTGKTSTARVIAKKLDCSPYDYQEIDAGRDRGIDAIRQIADQMKRSPIGGDVRVYVIDECFPRGTRVTLADGTQKNIESVHVGDAVFNPFGGGRVLKVFKNTVPVQNICRLLLSDGTSIVTTRSHLFLTETGWTKASDLLNNHIFKHVSQSVRRSAHASKQHETLGVHLRILQTGVTEDQTAPETQGGLLLQQKVRCLDAIIGSFRNARMQDLQKIICCAKNTFKDILFPVMCRSIKPRKSIECRQSFFSRNTCKDEFFFKEVCKNTGRNPTSRPIIQKNDSKLSFEKPRSYRKNKSNQEKERYSQRLGWHEGREWTPDDPANRSLQSAEQVETGVDYGASYFNGRAYSGLSDKLQGRHCFASHSGGYRGGWKGASNQTSEGARCEKDKSFEKIRVVRVENYERSDPSWDHRRIGSPEEIDRGFVTFYDLEIDSHPSYLAESTVVHNCHSLPALSQDALLKMLEDTPKHVYFILCTTDPAKIKRTVRTRCTELQFKNISKQDAIRLIRKISASEGIDLADNVVDKVADAGEGSPRMLLNLLHSVIGLKDSEAQIEAISRQSVETMGIDIARVLLNPKGGFSHVAKLLQNFDGDPESVRWVVLGYANKVLLSSKSQRAYDVISAFRYNFCDTKNAGLAAACYELFK